MLRLLVSDNKDSPQRLHSPLRVVTSIQATHQPTSSSQHSAAASMDDSKDGVLKWPTPQDQNPLTPSK